MKSRYRDRKSGRKQRPITTTDQGQLISNHMSTFHIFGIRDILAHITAIMKKLIKVMIGTSVVLMLLLFGYWIMSSNLMMPFNFQRELETEKNSEELTFLLGEIQLLLQQLVKLKEDIATVENNIKDFVIQTIEIKMQNAQAAEMISKQKLRKMLSIILKKIAEDHVQVADYALKSSGARIVLARTSNSFTRAFSSFPWHYFNLGKYKSHPDSILQPDVYPGNCWAFPGSQGETVIQLVATIKPKAVTIQHIPKAISPTGHIRSAPREFAIYGLKDQYDFEGTLLGRFTYDAYGDPIQTFHLKGEGSFGYIQLKVLSNWGNKEYTSLYRVRVHKEMPNSIIT
uniref:SUN domain-containing protein 3-like isoform X2 n=1 Tax=Geotrypetes seraphini TaxID=260995 RepID=A0A6P8PMM4_GEOSA|nr:SUN domain-containing protein 3-like isoform X2 [Geotrypetes seraphini]